MPAERLAEGLAPDESATLAESAARLSPEVQPLSQHVSLTLDPAQPSYSGHTQLTLQALTPTTLVQFHSRDLQINSIELRYQGQTFNLSSSSANKFDIVSVRLPTKVLGPFVLTLTFKGQTNEQSSGLYRYQQNKQHYLFTQFQAMLARSVFPVLDEPALKIPFQFTFTVPEAYDVLHNTDVQKVSREGAYKHLEFAATAKIPSDVLAFAVGKFEAHPIPGMPLPAHFYTVPGHGGQPDRSAALIAPIFNYIAGYFNQPYAYQKLDFLLLPKFDFAGMENAGLIVLNADENLFFQDLSDDERCESSFLIAHEIAHMWFGNLVTMHWWNDLWLNESFAEWLAGRTVNVLNPELSLCGELPQSRALSDDVNQAAMQRQIETVADVESYGDIVYSKGHALLNMVEQYLGSEMFDQVINRYVDRYADSSATADELISLFSQVDHKLSAVFNSFLRQPGFPLLSLSRDEQGWLLSQQPFTGKEQATEQGWTIPIRLKIFEAQGVREHSLILASAEQRLDNVPKDAVIFADSAAHGYYRIKNDSDNKLIDQLQQLNQAEQTSWLQNQQQLAEYGYLPLVTHLQQQLALLTNPNIDAQAEAMLLDSVMDNVLQQLPDSIAHDYAAKVAATLQARLTAIDWASITENPQASQWLWLAGVYLKIPAVLDTVLQQQSMILNKLDSLPTDLRSPLLRILAIQADSTLFAQLQHVFLQANGSVKNDVLSAMGYVQDPQLVDDYYDLLLSEASDNLVIDYRFQYPFFSSALRATASDYLQQHQTAIRARINDEKLQWMPLVFMTTCDVQSLQAMQTLFKNWQDIAGLSTKQQEMTEDIQHCIDNFATNQTAVEQWLASQ
ncbi:MAG: M1 family metallopeptidase [Paraglaciecola sp.]|nr:M1 family metallopeptidase [Paraglaciecola sp.]